MARTKKKGRALKVTRPKPTIYGNCDSWNFIVGKKPRAYSRALGHQVPLQGRNSVFTHSLSTSWRVIAWDNMWAICGCAVNRASPSRMVVIGPVDMRPRALP
jgi:hypothetical protein